MFIYAHLETLSAMIIRCFLMHSNLNKEREILLYMDSGILQGKKSAAIETEEHSLVQNTRQVIKELQN